MSLATYRELRPAYGFDEVAIVPGSITVNPELTDIQFSIGEHAFNFPILATALDAVVVACTPANTKKLAPIAVDAGADIFVVQSTVTTARHISTSPRGLILDELVANIRVPVVVGNTVGFNASLELMETGIAGLMVGVGPGAICTSREVLGIGVPQVAATIDCAASRDQRQRDI